MKSCETVSLTNEMRLLMKSICQTMPDNPILSGWSAYSQCDEDGIIRECLRRISGTVATSKTFMEIGCSDGLENNTHMLLIDGFRGIWIDGDPGKIDHIKKMLGGSAFERLWVLEAMVSVETSGDISRRAYGFLGAESLDFISLDIDGNDWHVMPTFIQALNPKLVCVEYNAKYPPPTSLVMDYSETHSWGGDDYFGASLMAWCDLMKRHGYQLICCNLTGANAFFVRDDLKSAFTVYPIEQVYQPPRYHLIEVPKGHPASLRWARQLLAKHDTDRLRFLTINSQAIPAYQFSVHTATDQFISGDIARTGQWEPFESNVFSRLCKPDDVFMDLGANIGWYSVLAAQLVGPEGHVVAVEPDPINIRVLETNAAVSDPHGVIKIIKAAVSDETVEKNFYKSKSNLGDHRLFSDGSPREVISVSVTTIDAILSSWTGNLPNILKSDTQGSEASILRGAERYISMGWRPIMILEFWPFGLEKAGDNPFELWLRLVELQYDIYEVVESNPRLIRVTKERLLSRLATDISPSSQGFINLLCMPDDSQRFRDIADLIDQV